MELQVTKSKNTTLITIPNPTLLIGEAGRQFEESLLQSIDEADGQYLLDLENVEYIEEEVVGALLVLQKVLNQAGGTLKLTGIRRAVRIIVEVLRLRDFFEIVDEVMPPVASMATAAAV